MNILDLGKKIASIGLPILGSLLGGPAGGMLGGLVSHALGLGGKVDPQAMMEKINANPAAAKLALQQLADDNQQAISELQALQTQAQQTGQTMRVEYGAGDPYVRRWRPTWGYVSSAAWAIEALAIVTGLVGGTVATLQGHGQMAKILLGAMPAIIGSMAALWSIALAVLGVSITQRSKDKQVQAGQVPAPGLLQALATRLAGYSKPESAHLIPPARAKDSSS